MSYFLTHLGRVGNLTFEHIELVVVSLAVALVIALPLGVLAARNMRIATPLLGVLGVIYTIPSLALLALLVKWIGLGFTTALIALAAYGQYILVRTIATALRGVPEASIDAARGLGYTPWQSLVRIELPLAAAAILGGIRIATVAMIGIATIAAYAGTENLGTLIFEGLAFKQPDRTLAGSISAMLLAITAGAIIRIVERRATRHVSFR